MEVGGGELVVFFVSGGGFQHSGGFGFIGRESQNNNCQDFVEALIHRMKMGRKINHNHF
jgi:hypothetical protein